MEQICSLSKKVGEDSPDCKIFKYKIKFQDNRPEGDACVFLQRFKMLYHPFSGINKQQQARWRKLGLVKEDFFACLDDFYPNGRHFPERDNYLRRGTGTQVLAKLLSDISQYAPKLIYAIPTNDGIKSFLLKNNWKSDYRNNKVLYKLL